MKYTIFRLAIISSVLLFGFTSLEAQRKIRLKKQGQSESTGKTTPSKSTGRIGRSSGLSLGKKDMWLAVGMSLTVPGSGHFYVGKYSDGAIFMVGSYGLMASGIVAMLTAHSTRDIVVNGKVLRVEDNTNQALFMMGSVLLTSGIMFYLGSVIDIFIDVTEHNRRIDRLRRYNKKVSQRKKSELYLAQARGSYYMGQTFRF